MSIQPTDVNGLAVDSQSLNALRYQAKQAPDKALKAVAQQFESVFMNMMMKSMRDATPQDGMFDNEQTKMFTEMLDQQLVQSMSKRGIGLADIMVKQLSRQGGLGATGTPAASPAATTAPAPLHALPTGSNRGLQQSFIKQMRAPAAQASASTGVPAQLILGQAALESGWGKRVITQADGSNSYNLFGIKAGPDWTGKVAQVTTTEYQNGVPTKQVQNFRAYGSYAESFQDYAHLLSSDPRYAGVVGQGNARAFAQGLQQAGYATDPHYADKLAGVIGSINTRA